MQRTALMSASGSSSRNATVTTLWSRSGKMTSSRKSKRWTEYLDQLIHCFYSNANTYYFFVVFLRSTSERSRTLTKRFSLLPKSTIWSEQKSVLWLFCKSVLCWGIFFVLFCCSSSDICASWTWSCRSLSSSWKQTTQESPKDSKSVRSFPAHVILLF